MIEFKAKKMLDYEDIIIVEECQHVESKSKFTYL